MISIYTFAIIYLPPILLLLLILWFIYDRIQFARLKAQLLQDFYDKQKKLNTNHNLKKFLQKQDELTPKRVVEKKSNFFSKLFFSKKSSD